MPKSELEKYVRKTLSQAERTHKESDAPHLVLKSDKEFGDRQFTLGCVPVFAPYEMQSDHHAHDFDQYLFFSGGDPLHMDDLGGIVEITLSEDCKNLKKFSITEATCVFIPAGLYHCPLFFKKINDPKKPIIFQNLFFASKYDKLPEKKTKSSAKKSK
jgi:hypothetical protein